MEAYCINCGSKIEDFSDTFQCVVCNRFVCRTCLENQMVGLEEPDVCPECMDSCNGELTEDEALWTKQLKEQL